jgi:transposase
LQAKMRDVELSLRGLLRGFGLKVGEISKGQFAARVRTLVAGHTMLERIAEAMLQAREALKVEFGKLHRAMLAIVRADAVCRRLMTVPGVGALVAVTFTSGVDAPERFARSKGVGAHFGLTPRKHQSGETDITGAVSRVGDVMVRTALYEAAHILLTRAVRFSALKRGPGGGEAARHEASEGGAGAQACGRSPPHVGGWHDLPLGPGGRGGVEPRGRGTVWSGARTPCFPEVPSPGRRKR